MANKKFNEVFYKTEVIRDREIYKEKDNTPFKGKLYCPECEQAKIFILGTKKNKSLADNSTSVHADFCTYNLNKVNKNKFKNEKLEFHCLDIAVDDLPFGNCALIRQVLQHLSNVEVQNILHKLKMYKYVILTEHIPNGEFTPNKEIISGQGTRLKSQSGINVFTAPFNFKVKAQKEVLAIRLNNSEGLIVTSLLTIF